MPLGAGAGPPTNLESSAIRHGWDMESRSSRDNGARVRLLTWQSSKSGIRKVTKPFKSKKILVVIAVHLVEVC
jgi:hypothetical protein